MAEDQKLESEVIKQAGETKRIVKNVVVMSLAFMIHFTAGFAMESLQSSINSEAGIGDASLAIVYIAIIVSCVFLPVVVIKWIGTKWAMCLSFLTYMPFFAAQLFPRFYTLIPAGVFVGLGAGVLWCANCTYISVVSKAHSKISNIPADALLVRFLGLFFMLFKMSNVWGNLISSLGMLLPISSRIYFSPHDNDTHGVAQFFDGNHLGNFFDVLKQNFVHHYAVLSSGNNQAAVTTLNETMVSSVCGAHYLSSVDDTVALQAQPPDKIQTLVGIYLAFVVVAVLIIAVGVDSTERYESDDCPSTGSGLTGLALLSATLKLLKEPNQLLLIMICVFLGLSQAFILADFTVAFVSCAIGTGTIGFVMIAYGVSDALGCAVTGYINKRTGRLPLICSALAVHSGLFVTLLVWRPHADANSSYVLYTVAMLWGLCESVWMVQINAYHGILFPGREEAAFCNFRLWTSLGDIIDFSISPYSRTSIKTYLLFATMLVGVAGYFTVEYRERRAKKKIEVKHEELCFTDGCINLAF